MPCSLLLRPPGGATGKVRKRYALIQKILLLEESNRLQRECNFSLRRAGEVLSMPFPLLSKWGKEVTTIRAAIRAERRAKKRKALLDGPAGQLVPIEEELRCFVFEKCEQGINRRMTGSTTRCSTARRGRAGTMKTARTRAMATEGRGGIWWGEVAYLILLN